MTTIVIRFVFQIGAAFFIILSVVSMSHHFDLLESLFSKCKEVFGEINEIIKKL